MRFLTPNQIGDDIERQGGKQHDEEDEEASVHLRVLLYTRLEKLTCRSRGSVLYEPSRSCWAE